MKRSSLLLTVLLMGTLGAMTGCDKAKEAVEAAKQGASEAAAGAKQSVSKEDAASEKLDAYIKGYNPLVGTWGLQKQYDNFQKYDFSKRKATDNISFSENSSSIDRAIESFRKGQAIKASGMEDIDAAVAELITAAEKLSAQQKDLKPYFESKKYQEDNLAKGKAAYPIMMENYKATISAFDKLSVLVSKYQRIETEKRIAKFKQSGDMVRYYTEEAMLQAQDLTSVFDDPEKAIKEQASYTKADAIIAKLEPALDAQRKAHEEAKSKNTKNISFYDSVNRELTSMVGKYRDLRTKKSPDAYNAMMGDYNDAVENYNRAAQFNRF